MTPEYTFDEDVTTSREFDRVLEDLLAAALENGVTVEGSWAYRWNSSDCHDVEAQFVRLGSRRTE